MHTLTDTASNVYRFVDSFVLDIGRHRFMGREQRTHNSGSCCAKDEQVRNLLKVIIFY